MGVFRRRGGGAGARLLRRAQHGLGGVGRLAFLDHLTHGVEALAAAGRAPLRLEHRPNALRPRADMGADGAAVDGVTDADIHDASTHPEPDLGPKILRGVRSGKTDSARHSRMGGVQLEKRQKQQLYLATNTYNNPRDNIITVETR